MADTLMVGLRKLALGGTALARTTCATLRLKLVKIGALIVRAATTVRVHLCSHHPAKRSRTRARRAVTAAMRQREHHSVCRLPRGKGAVPCDEHETPFAPANHASEPVRPYLRSATPSS